MRTYTAMLITYGKAHVPLSTVAADYLPHLNDRELKRRAKVQALPFPVFRGESQKAVYMVDLHDVAEWVDGLKKQARYDHEAMAS